MTPKSRYTFHAWDDKRLKVQTQVNKMLNHLADTLVSERSAASKNRDIVHALEMQSIAHEAYKKTCRRAYRSKAVRDARSAYRGYQAELIRLMGERNKAKK